MKIYVIEDNPVYNDYVCNLLKKEGFDTVQAFYLNTARNLLQKTTEEYIVLADLRLPDGESIDLLRWMRANGKEQPFIVMTNYGEVNSAVESMKLGSKDYIQKPLLEDRLVPLVRSIQKEQEKRRQRQIPIFKRSGEAFVNIRKRIRLVAPTRMSVLILGENGTGKEHIAQQSTPKANCLTSRLWQWIVAHCHRHWRSPLSSGTSKARSQERTRTRQDTSGKPTAARCSLTRWAT